MAAVQLNGIEKMKLTFAILFCVLVSGGVRSAFIDDTIVYGNFPNNFIWAAATASYQVEGAWNVDGII